MAELVWKNKFSSTKLYTEANPPADPDSASPPAHFFTQAYHVPSLESPTPNPTSTVWHNRLISGDNHTTLPLLHAEFLAQVKLIYIDPPFMTGRTFTHGENIAYKDTWRNSLDTYLQWLYDILNNLYQLLAPDGCLYIHLDWRVTHYVKVMLDEIFGFYPLTNGPGFKNEIIWHYQSGGRANKRFARKHDTLLFYTKSAQYSFHSERISQKRGSHKRNHMRKEVGADGTITWSIRSAGRLYTYHEDTLMSHSDVWSDISHLHQKDPERTGYATQKPQALLERIVLASSDVDDLVLDCFCGSGVMPVVAEQLSRRWVACDKSDVAIAITQQRLLANEIHSPFVLQHLVPSQQNEKY
ncbi:MAG TPA: site-specific DNA-methyltransferase [Ktedonobacteraceae bacterium]|nr:site-specific DNA-methyltransferase [Ktedonobacteraceae bacterium]